MKATKLMTKLSVDSFAQEYEYDRGLISDMSEAVRIGNRPQFELNFDNRQYSTVSVHGIQSFSVFESADGKIMDIPTLR